MPQARRTNHISPTERAALKREALDEVREALDSAEDFESFQEALVEPDHALPSLEDVKKMTPEQINANWDAVATVLEQEGQRPIADNRGAPLTMESIRAMSMAEYQRRQVEVDAFVRRQPRSAA